ncbi:hypothetical protein EDB89DRAFT_2031693, partial [Lactarius sanguifluus]
MLFTFATHVHPVYYPFAICYTLPTIHCISWYRSSAAFLLFRTKYHSLLYQMPIAIRFRLFTARVLLSVFCRFLTILPLA